MSVKLGDVEVAGFSGGGSIDAIDDITITKNSDDEIQAVAVVDQNTGIVKTWTGTAAEYDAIVTKDPDTEYIIIDDIGDSATEIGEITEDINELKAHEIIEFQAPTAENNYTWYRKYADGWVEQGGQYIGIVGVSTGVSITLPVTMTDANYTLNITGEQNSNNWAGAVIRNGTRTTTGFQAYVWGGGSGDQIRGLCWTVQGMAA